MALGAHPAFVDSAIWPSPDETSGKAAGKPVTSQLPYFVSVPFTMQSQAQSNWCWAAVAVSTSLYYASTSSWTQCTLVNAYLTRTDCCTAPLPTGCNEPGYLEAALTVTGNFVSETGPISTAAVRAELDAGRPVLVDVSWSGGGSHSVAIWGYSFIMQTHRYDIADPFYGKSTYTAQYFNDYYQGTGSWTSSYYTQAPP